MNLLLLRKISPDVQAPDFGPEFARHMAGKTHPEGRIASLNAWALLAKGLAMLGEPMQTVAFRESGKPYFMDSPLHFSLSHSGEYAAALIADIPCGVDVEERRPVSEKLILRCIHPDERAAGMDFFEVWTKKECIAKLDGSGMRSHPDGINSLRYAGWLTRCFTSEEGRLYQLSAICANGEKIESEL